MLQGILKRRGLHFLVPPFNASAQLAYFDMIDSEQCSAIMGSQELLLYPIKDFVIRFIDWDNGKFSAISKKNAIKNLGVTEPMFTDALLMTGTSFLPTFPPLRDNNIVPRASVQDAVNLLRTSEKAVASACASFNDILQAKDPHWLQKYRKAKMSIDHFIYISEAGEVKVHDFNQLTNDNWEYLGYQLPAELLHYLNTGLIGAHTLSWITHGQVIVLPTLDGVRSEEYKQLVTNQLMPLREMTLALLLPRLTRGIQFKPISVKVWYDDKYTHKIEYRPNDNPTLKKVHTWTVKDDAVKQYFPAARHGSILFEVTALRNADFAKTTIISEKIKGVNSADSVLSLTLWRWLHLRGYANENHRLTTWGEALATSLEALDPTVKKHAGASGLFEAVLLGFELLRFGLLSTRNQHSELGGLPMNGSDEDKASLLLISRCAILLKLRHQANGYTGPLIKTLLDDINPSDSAEVKATKKAEFPGKFVPYATHFFEDLDIACEFFGALHAGIKTLEKEVPVADRAVWDKAAAYLKVRR
ncbi:hypothetical protein SLS62_000738 [Diatrype stigma]|uniref:Uncharacterized protein n=1 Tax=Diatrype stigma TaxID=117547 RepID=A0AAN9YWP3_9PEZI